MQRHETNVLSLVLGIVFVSIAALWALQHYDIVTARAFGILGPAALIGAGVAGVAASLTRARRGQ